MFGVEETENEDLLNKVISVFTSAEIDIKNEDINSVKRLGVNKNSRPILIIFKEVHPKILIFKNVVKFRESKIFVANDLPKEQRIRIKEIRAKLFDYKQKLETIGRSAQVRNTKLYCENKIYDVHSALEYIHSLNLGDTAGKYEEIDYESDSADSVKSHVSTASRKRGRPEGSKNNPLKKRTKKTSPMPPPGTSPNIKEYFHKEGPVNKDSNNSAKA